ncbi:MAG: hypothetical protein RIB58_02505 [Phycisphaerales bacterium]
MDALPDPRLIMAIIAAFGIAAMLLTLAAAIRHGVSIISLEARVKAIREEQRQLLIARGALAADPDELTQVDIIDIIDDEAPSDALPADEPQRQAA